MWETRGLSVINFKSFECVVSASSMNTHKFCCSVCRVNLCSDDPHSVFFHEQKSKRCAVCASCHLLHVTQEHAAARDGCPGCQCAYDTCRHRRYKGRHSHREEVIIDYQPSHIELFESEYDGMDHSTRMSTIGIAVLFQTKDEANFSLSAGFLGEDGTGDGATVLLNLCSILFAVIVRPLSDTASSRSGIRIDADGMASAAVDDSSLLKKMVMALGTACS